MILTEIKEDNVRFVRLCVLVIVKGRDVLEHFFKKKMHKKYGRSKSFSEFLSESQTKRTLVGIKEFTVEHRKLLYPENNPATKDSNGNWLGEPNKTITPHDLDINMLYLFLRHLCGMMSPERNIWRNPWPGDNRPEACITRIRIYRNKVAYNKTCTISEKEFDELWNERVGDLETLSNLYAAEYYNALGTLSFNIHNNRCNLIEMCHIVRKMSTGVYEEIRELESEIEKLFEGLSVTNVPKIKFAYDTGKKKEKPRLDRKGSGKSSIKKSSKWHKLRELPVEEFSQVTPIMSKREEISSKAPEESSGAEPLPEKPKIELQPGPIIEIHPPPPVPQINIEEKPVIILDIKTDDTDNPTAEPAVAVTIKETDKKSDIIESAPDFPNNEPKIVADNKPVADEDSGEDDKSRRKPDFKLAHIVKDIMKVRDELDQNQQKIKTILKRASSEERRANNLTDSDDDDVKNGFEENKLASKKSTRYEDRDTLRVNRELTPKRSVPLAGYGVLAAGGVGALMRQMHGNRQQIPSPQQSPFITRKTSPMVPRKDNSESNDKRKNDGDGDGSYSSASGSGSESDEYFEEGGRLIMKPKSKSNYNDDTTLFFPSGGRGRDRDGGYGRNSFGFAMGPGMHHLGARPGMYQGLGYGGRYGRGGGPGTRMRMERKGTKYRARSSGHAGRHRRQQGGIGLV